MKKILLTLMFLPLFYANQAVANEETKIIINDVTKDSKPKKKTWFENIDTSADGVVSFEEYQANSEKRFNKLDKDGDKKLTEAEMKNRRKTFGGKKEKETDEKPKNNWYDIFNINK